jgi:hypothetical protein
MNPVRLLPPYFPEIHSNVIPPSTPRSSEWCFPCRLLRQNFVHIFHLSYALDMFNILMSLCNFLDPPVILSLLGPNILLNTLFSNTLNLFLPVTGEIKFCISTKLQLKCESLVNTLMAESDFYVCFSFIILLYKNLTWILSLLKTWNTLSGWNHIVLIDISVAGKLKLPIILFVSAVRDVSCAVGDVVQGCILCFVWRAVKLSAWI